jgi:hypothetical protein
MYYGNKASPLHYQKKSRKYGKIIDSPPEALRVKQAVCFRKLISGDKNKGLVLLD